jgi:Secretion system C-terminal sorting domain
MPFDMDKRIPFSVRCDKTTSFKFTVGNFINYDLSEVVYIFDKVTGVYTDISNSFYEVSLEAGTNDRFEITFKNANALGIPQETISNFGVYQNNTTKNVTISNPQQLELTSCGLYDIAGKLIFNKKQLGSETSYKFSTSGLSDGIYIVKLSSKDKAEMGKKIIVTN